MASLQNNFQMTLSSEILAEARCVACGCTDTTQFHLAFQKPEMQVLRCQNCDFVFVPPFYRKQISYLNYKGQDVLEQVRKGNNWLKIQSQKVKFGIIQKYMPSGKLFDLGCGWGHFLLTAKELGYDIYGVEISKHLFEYCTKDLNLPVEDRNLFDMDETKQFDVLTMWDVLEHIDDADKFVEKCSKLVRKGGYMFIQVPQIDSFLAKKYKEKWKMMSLDHVNYFSPKTLGTLLERYGFRLVESKSSIDLKIFLMYYILPWLRKKKTNAIENQPVAISSAERQAYFNQLTHRPMWQLKIMSFGHHFLYKLLSLLKIGEEMIVVAERK